MLSLKKMAKRKEVIRIVSFLLVVTFFVLVSVFYLEFSEKEISESIFSEDHFFSTPILIGEANHFSSEKEKNIFSRVNKLDGILSEKVYSGDSIKISFYENLTSKNDLKIYVGEFSGEEFFVEVYEVFSGIKVSEFPLIETEGIYRTELFNLQEESNSFELKFYELGNNFDSYLKIDYITDPITGGTTSGGLRPQTVVCTTQGSITTCQGTYPASCTTGDYLSCNDANEETHSTRKSNLASIEGTYFDTGITDCISVDLVQACYRWRASSAGADSCSFNFDESGDGYSGISTTCPTTTETSGCIDITSSDTWACSNFFGGTGNRAKLRLLASTSANPTTTIYFDEMWYNVTYTAAGSLNVVLNEPSVVSLNEETINEIFILNATVTCAGNAGEVCGDITAMARYNSTSSLPDTQISSVSGGTPLFANLGNQSCSKLNVTSGENTCTISWQINATEIGDYEVDVLFTSEYSVVPNNDTLDAQIRVLDEPELVLNLTSPLSDPGISEGQTFDVNCTANCYNQNCEDVIVNLVYCEGSQICSPDTVLDTTSSGLVSNVNSVNLGIVSPGIPENAIFTVTGELAGDYVLMCNSSSSNAGYSLSSENLSFNVNDYPVADFFYPSQNEWLHGTEILNGSASTDSDGTITNYKFEIDDNSAFSSSTTICDSSSEECSLNTITQSECGQETSNCFLRLNVTDDDNTFNSTIIQIGIDNVGPTATLGVPENFTFINTENQLINSSAEDSGSGVNCLEFEAYYNGIWNSLNVDCSLPYEYNWDLSLVTDQENIEVRSRANDSEGNFGSYDLHSNITHDTTKPVVISDSPLENEIINTSIYVLNATSSYDLTSGIKNVSWYYYNSTSSSWNLIGTDANPFDGLTYVWNVNIPDETYDLMINVTDNASLENFTIVQNFVVDVENSEPFCVVNFPSGGEELNGGVLLNVSAFDSDPSDYIVNSTFEYSLNGGSTWNLIGSNLSSSLEQYTYLWDSTGDLDSNDYYVRCNVSDSRGGEGTNISSSNFTIDNAPPLIYNERVNSTSISLNTPICMNVTVTDNLVGVKQVIAEIDPPTGPNENVTLLDDGLGCDDLTGDNIYSIIYVPVYSGVYNWTKTYAYDDLNNLNFTYTGIEGTVTANAYLISNLISPLIDFEINESFPYNNFTIECNITCNASGADCDNVAALVEYDDGGFKPVTTLTTDLVNDEDFYSCGNLLSGDSCIHIFNVTAGENSGGDSWDLRCTGSSTNAASDVSTTVNVHVNDYPVADFFYPSQNEWLHGTEILNGSASTDSDGTITNYKFEIDDNSAFSSSTTICDSSSEECSLNTITQSECGQETSNCFLRLNVTDDDNTFNSTIIQIGIDNVGPTATLGVPENFTFINTENQLINSSAEDSGSGVNCLEFEAYYNGIWNSLNVDCSLPYEYNWDLSLVTDQENIEVRSRANDSEGNFGSYDLHSNITHDTTKPVVLLQNPRTFEIFGIRDLFFNFSVTDNLASTLNCSLILDSEVNQTFSFIEGGSSFFFVEGINEGEHEWRINCTDEALNTNSSETRIFTIDLTPPLVSLNFPLEGEWINSADVNFNYTPFDLHLESCSLYGNWSLGWHKNETIFSLNNNSFNLFTKNIPDGNYIWNVECNDSVGNSAFNSTNNSFYIDTTYPLISIEESSTKNNSLSSDTWIFLNVSIIENNLDSVFFSWQGVNESFDNSFENFYWENKTSLSDGVYYFRAYSNDSAGNLNLTEERVFRVDTISPNWSNLNQTIEGIYSEVYHRGDSIDLSSYWEDTFELNSSWLSTNESGIWQNISGVYSSPQLFSGSNNFSSFNWSNNSVSPGEEVYWRIYGEDYAGNINSTSESSFVIWGWSEIGDYYVSPRGVASGDSTIFSCKVQDNLTNEPLENYQVYFYNETDYLGSNLTGVDGYAIYNVTLYGAGMHTLRCNVTDDPTKYYNDSNANFAQTNVGVDYLLEIYDFTDTSFNKAYEGTTDTTTTEIDDPYTDLTSDDNVNYQTYRASAGNYAYTRFEFRVNETANQLLKMNITWSGYGIIGAGTPGYILYLYNVTSGTWKQEISYSAGSTDRIENIVYTNNFEDFIDSEGYIKVLVRSFSVAPTTGAGGNRWVEINNDYIDLKLFVDILPPHVELISPENGLFTNQDNLDLVCSVSDDVSIANVSLYGNWTEEWVLNETNSSGMNDVNYSFSKSFSDGTYIWNCLACDNAGNCLSYNVENYTFSIDSTPPEVNLIYPYDFENFTGYEIPFVNFRVLDSGTVEKCEIYGKWNELWHLNQTYNSPVKENILNFSGVTVEGDEFYSWNVNCTDEAGNSGFNSTNFTFSAFLPPWVPEIYNVNQSRNDGTGNITLVWNSSNHSYEFEIYYSEDMKTFNYLNKTNKTNYTDDTFSGNKRRYYNVVATNPLGQNSSQDYFGAHVYTLKHDGVSSRNLLGFPTNFSYLEKANETLEEINNAVSISKMNFTSQEIVYCNDFSCPSDLFCTPTSCNFEIIPGESYDVEINTSGASQVNWSGVGLVYEPLSIEMGYNDPNVLKNRKWISLYPGTDLINAEDLFNSLGNVDAVTNWREDLQTSEGFIKACSPWNPSLCFNVGENFNLEVEKGYEVSSTAVGTWIQE